MEPDDPRREWLKFRPGNPPRTTPDDPHRQLTQIAPIELQDALVERGWGEQHPVAKMGLIPMNTLMVYGPRDEEELDVVFLLLKTSYGYARGEQAG